MGFDDRLTYLLLGCLIGLVLGYGARYLQEIKEEVDEIDEIVKKSSDEKRPRARDEGGFMRNTIVADILMMVVVSIVAIGAFQTQKVNNDVKDANKRLDLTTSCTQKILFEAIDALNERTTYTTSQAISNVNLQKSQAKMLKILLHIPPYTDAEKQLAANQYLSDLASFLDVSNKTARKVLENQYPTVDEYRACLNGEDEE